MTHEEQKDYANAKYDVIKALDSIRKLKPEYQKQLAEELFGAELCASAWKIFKNATPLQSQRGKDMEHFITEVQINEVRHLENITIKLNSEKRQHLILTGKNGSGKTSVLRAMKSYLQAINDGKLNDLTGQYQEWYEADILKVKNASTENEKYKATEEVRKDLQRIQRYNSGLVLAFKNEDAIDTIYAQGNFITAYFSADRESVIQRVIGAQDVKLENYYRVTDEPSRILLKYMVHLKTQQAYAKNEDDLNVEEKIAAWFERFENALKVLLDDDSIKLIYDYRNYNFLIEQNGRNPYSLDELSDGYSAIIGIVADLILRMDRNWLLKGELSQYDVEGVVLIDELETHLHVELQRKIFPFLTEFFPRIQFVVTTHSAYILNSISNACIYDLEKQVQFTDFSSYSVDNIAEGYLDAEAYSDETQKKAQRYEELYGRTDLSDEQRAERAALRIELKDAKEVLEKIEGKKVS